MGQQTSRDLDPRPRCLSLERDALCQFWEEAMLRDWEVYRVDIEMHVLPPSTAHPPCRTRLHHYTQQEIGEQEEEEVDRIAVSPDLACSWSGSPETARRQHAHRRLSASSADVTRQSRPLGRHQAGGVIIHGQKICDGTKHSKSESEAGEGEEGGGEGLLGEGGAEMHWYLSLDYPRDGSEVTQQPSCDGVFDDGWRQSDKAAPNTRPSAFGQNQASGLASGAGSDQSGAPSICYKGDNVCRTLNSISVVTLGPTLYEASKSLSKSGDEWRLYNFKAFHHTEPAACITKHCGTDFTANHSSPFQQKGNDSQPFGRIRPRSESLKDYPGWIPNPLDSDTDSDNDKDDLNDSDIFFGPVSPAIPASIQGQRAPPATRRRRYYSEPLGGGRDIDTKSLPCSPPPGATCLTHSSEHTWTLVRLLLRLRKRLQAESVAAAREVSEGSPTHRGPQLNAALAVEEEMGEREEDIDLEAELKWLTEGTDTWPQGEDTRPEGMKIGEGSGPVSAVCDLSTAVSTSQTTPATLPPFLPIGVGPDVQVELEWLCEPEWNNVELQLFWGLIRPHLQRLLARPDLLPHPCPALITTHTAHCKMLDRCLLHVQWHIWQGRYRQAVADFKAVRRHFRSTAQSRLIPSRAGCDDIESLRLLFHKKRPNRFRLWI